MKLIFSLKKRPVPVNYTRSKFFSLNIQVYGHGDVKQIVFWLNMHDKIKWKIDHMNASIIYIPLQSFTIIYIPIHIKGFIFARLFDFLPCSNSSSLIWSKIWSDANFCSQSFWGFFYYWFYDYTSSYVPGCLELTISCLRDWL